MQISALQHSFLAALATLVFAFVMSLPGVCAMAMADSGADEEWKCACLGSTEDSEPGDDEGCQCGCGLVKDGQDRPDVEPVQIAMVNAEDELSKSAPNLWWTPELIAALWVIDQLDGALILTDPALPPVAALSLWDQSDLYLKNSILLI